MPKEKKDHHRKVIEFREVSNSKLFLDEKTPEDWDTPGFQLTQTWWFSTPDWPRPGHDFNRYLKKFGFREVRLSDWEDEPDIDSEG